MATIQLLAVDESGAPVNAFLPVIPSAITRSQTIPTNHKVLMYDGTTINTGSMLTFQGNASVIFLKNLQLRSSNG